MNLVDAKDTTPCKLMVREKSVTMNRPDQLVPPRLRRGYETRKMICIDDSAVRETDECATKECRYQRV